MTDSYEAKVDKICDILNIDRSALTSTRRNRGEEYVSAKLEALEWLMEEAEDIETPPTYTFLLQVISDRLTHRNSELNRAFRYTKYMQTTAPEVYIKLTEQYAECISANRDLTRYFNEIVTNELVAKWATTLAFGYESYRAIMNHSGICHPAMTAITLDEDIQRFKSMMFERPFNATVVTIRS